MEPEYSTMSSEGSVLSSEMSHESLRMEECRVGGVELRLPQGLCENKEIFREFFSMRTWQECFNDQQREHLKSFLPNFPGDRDEEEKEETLRRLFACENFHFGSPLTDFFAQLTSGYFRPDIAHMRSLVKKAHKRDYR
ncbi:Nuclear factor related to kappa-b-binding protein isoform x2 [Gryllus bimaculatus]|nr:Nuclear factor related to kappa-b-binding protein isoform x2 [Gryllus bimaculatus]